MNNLLSKHFKRSGILSKTFNCSVVVAVVPVPGSRLSVLYVLIVTRFDPENTRQQDLHYITFHLFNSFC